MGWMSKLQLIPDSALTTTMSRLGLGFTQPPTEAVPTIKQPNCGTVITSQSLIKQRDNLTDTIFLSKINLNCTGRKLTWSVLLVTAGVQ